MLRKGAKKRKPSFVLFPQEQEIGSIDGSELQTGKVLRIGRPSNRYYQYISTSLNFLNQKLSDLSELIGLEGKLVKVIGIIGLKGGEKYAIVEQHGQEGRSNSKRRLFINTSKALKFREIIFEY